MEVQEGDEEVQRFSFTDTPQLKKQRPCHITYTNGKVHDILKTVFEKSPMFTGGGNRISAPLLSFHRR